MSNSTAWWVLAGAMVALELFTGTFYLLMLTIGMVAGALAAMAGFGLIAQLLIAAAVGSAAVVGWYFKKTRHANGLSASSLQDGNLDVGEIVHIEQWQPDGTAQVKYRGSQWAAIHRTGVIPAPGPHRVAELIGSRLLVDKM
jgi:membrane protein implicated in regulation of membrane protease activity